MGKHREPILFTKFEKEFIDGCILGDGYIESPKHCLKSCCLRYNSSKFQHTQYVYENLKRFSRNAHLNGPTKSVIFDKITLKTYTSYGFSTISNLAFYDFRNRWYDSNRIKFIPKDLKITNVVALIWYLGDGGLLKMKTSQGLKLSTHCFKKEDLEKIIIPQLSDFEASLMGDGSDQYTIYIPRRKILKFLNFIGNPPFEEYAYKWNFKPYKYKSVEMNGVSNYDNLYPLILDDWKTDKFTIYQLCKKYSVPIRCIKDFFNRENVIWQPKNMKKQIVQLDLHGNCVNVWESASHIKKTLGFVPSHISRCCLGKIEKYNGFVWKFKNKND